MKGFCCTDPSNHSQSLIMKICSPSNMFQNEPTKWGTQNETQTKKELLLLYKQNHENAKLAEN